MNSNPLDIFSDSRIETIRDILSDNDEFCDRFKLIDDRLNQLHKIVPKESRSALYEIESAIGNVVSIANELTYKRGFQDGRHEHINRDMGISLKLNDGNQKIITGMANILLCVQNGKMICPANLSKFRIMRAMNHCSADALDLVAGILDQDWMDLMFKIAKMQAGLNEEEKEVR